MTARGGSLFLGLKAPLDASGRALVWKLDDPERLLAGGALAPGQLALWARVPLEADRDGRAVPGGIAELLFAGDGALLVSATPSRGDGVVDSGRLYRVATPAPGILAPALVRVFAGLKPEGLALDHTGRGLVVVFDRGDATPLWITLPGGG
jgi:hypothetical protein